MIVRQAGVEDSAAIQAIDQAVLGTDERASALAASIADGHCWVALLDGTVAGYALFTRSFFSQPFIELMITHPRYRRRGVGTALLRHLESLCPGAKLFTSTNQSNQPMHRLCAANGYVRSGYIDNLGDGDPEIIYVKHLARSAHVPKHR